MRICIVASGDFFSSYGGGQVYVRNIVDAFIQQRKNIGVDISVLSIATQFQNGYVVKEYNEIFIYEINLKGNIEQLIKDLKPDIVHINGHKLLIAQICKKLNIPTIVTAHHGGLVCPAGALMNTKDEICHIPAEYNSCLKCYLRNTKTGLFWYPLLKRFSQKRYFKIGELLNRLPFIPFLSPIGKSGIIVNQKIQDWQKLCENTTHFIAPSDAMAEALERNGCPQEKISVIPHGIPPIDNVGHKTSDIGHKPIKFYYVGRICYIKGLHIMLEAFHNVNNKDIELHIIGEAVGKKEKKYAKKLHFKYKNDSRILWYGKLKKEELYSLISGYDVLIHPAICLEAFGLDIAESLQLNKYVIATKCGGAEMQIRHNHNGYLVAPNNTDELIAAINKYIADNPKHKNDDFSSISLETHIQKLMVLYNRCLH